MKSWLHVCTQLQLLFSYSYESGIVFGTDFVIWYENNRLIIIHPMFAQFLYFLCCSPTVSIGTFPVIYLFFCYFSLQQMDLLPESGSVGVFFLFSLHGQRLLAHIESFGSSLLNYKVLTLLYKVPWDNKSRFGTV